MSEGLRRTLLLGAGALVLLAIGLRLAWVGDDAWITLRSVENWVAGEGLRWNTADRVQTYTHPLWMLLLAATRWLAGEPYFGTIVLGLSLSTTAVLLLLRRATTSAAVVACTALLVGTRAFPDYMTSGLETPLTYLLLVLFVGVVADDGGDRRRFPAAVLLASLLATTRMDLALLAAPAVLATLRGWRFGPAVKAGAVAALPFLLWVAFAVVYYGSPFPVTAHAKAFGVGIPAGDLALQGLRYARFALTDDPVLLPTVVAGLLIGLWHARTRWLALGAVFYLGYVLKVGGDFMAGRFFLPPFVVAVAVLAPWLSARRWPVGAAVALLAMALLFVRGVPPWLRDPASDLPATQAEIEAQHGIVDERRVHWQGLGLFAAGRALPRYGALAAMAWPEGRRERWFLLNGSVGTAGFQMGAHGHLVDPLLCDPLLTRLPARDPQRWRIGHVLRRIPEGYYESLATGENRILHSGLRAYWEALRTVTRAPLCSGERLAAGWSLLSGELDAGFRQFVAEHYHQPPRVPIAAAELPPELPLGVFWFDEPRLRIVYDGGVAVALAAPRSATSLRLQVLAGFHRYRVRFVRNGEVRSAAFATPLPPPANLTPLQLLAGLQEQLVLVPEHTGMFDTLWLDAVETPDSHKAPGPPGLGAVTFEP